MKGLLDAVQNPLVLMGLSGFARAARGDDVTGGWTAGADMASSLQSQQMRRQAADEDERRKKLMQQFLSGPSVSGLPPALRDIAQITGDLGSVQSWITGAGDRAWQAKSRARQEKEWARADTATPAADTRVVGNKVVRVQPDGRVEEVYSADQGISAESGDDALLGQGGKLTQSFLSGNFDADLASLMEQTKPEQRWRLWTQAMRLKKQLEQGGTPPPTIASGPAAPLAAPPQSLDQQRLQSVKKRYADAPAAQQNDAIKTQAAANAIEKSLDRYEQLVGQTGYVLPGDVTDRDAVGAEIRNLQLQLKELYNLGVLNGPDLSLMEQMLFDPRIGSMGDGAEAAYDSMFGSGAKARSGSSIARLRTILNDILTGRNLEPLGRAGRPAPGPGKDQQRLRYNPATGELE